MRNKLRAELHKPMSGIEIGPAFSPILPKKMGFDVKVIDHADKNALYDKYKNDANVKHLIDNIEEVDATDDGRDFLTLLNLEKKVNYIVSSHNFEHLPDPILFLMRCEQAINDAGRVHLFIPDRRGTFDYFRPVSSGGQILEAFEHSIKRHSFSAFYDTIAYHVTGNSPTGSTELTNSPVSAYKNAKLFYRDNEYHNSHHWVFTPSSFSLLIDHLRILDLIHLQIDKIISQSNSEFYVSLVKTDQKIEQSQDSKLYHKILKETVNPERTANESHAIMSLEQKDIDKLRVIDEIKNRLPNLTFKKIIKYAMPFIIVRLIQLRKAYSDKKAD